MLELMKRFALYQDDPEGGDPEGGGGGGGSEGGDPPKEKGPRGISPEVLPQELRNRSEAEVKVILNQAFKRLGEVNDENQTLRQQLQEVQSAPPRESDPPPEEVDDEELEDLMVRNPREAIRKVVASEFGGAFSSLQSEVGEAVFMNMRQTLPDFEDMEEDVRDVMKRSGVPATKQNVLGAYKIALGERTLNDRMRSMRKEDNPDIPDPPEDETKDEEPQLSTLENEVRRSMGMSAKEYAEWRDKEVVEVEVPTS